MYIRSVTERCGTARVQASSEPTCIFICIYIPITAPATMAQAKRRGLNAAEPLAALLSAVRWLFMAEALGVEESYSASAFVSQSF